MKALHDALVALAGSCDDDPAVEKYLREIAQLAPATVGSVDSASITVARDGRYVTLAASDDLASGMDQAQYSAAVGPCLQALRSDEPCAVPEAAATAEWPRFRERAMSSGLFAALSIPLHAGSGATVAALNLYARRPAAMSGLIVEVLALYHPDRRAPSRRERLHDGGEHLVEGLAAALQVHDDIQHALGALMAERGIPARDAYAALCDLARARGSGLHTAALARLTHAE